MGRRSLSQAAAATIWLPGFEPEDLGSAKGAAVQQLLPVAVHPPAPPTVVAVAAAQVVVQALSANDPIVLPQTQQALEVLGSETIQLDPVEPISALEALEAAPEVPPHRWPAFDATRYAPPTGDEQRINANLRAIRLSKQLLEAGREPTDSERHELLSYAGWGGLARIFEDLSRNPYKDKLEQLKAQLSDQEFNSARSTVTDAFYTDQVLVGAMWDVMRRFGFVGGRVIEPAAGTGLFIAGMPAELAAKSEITLVEKDAVSGNIMRAAFGGTGVNTHVCGLEKAPVPHNFFDLAISNVPFGDVKVAETRKVGYANWSIHNWMAAKCVDLVRPGGLVAIITSRFTMDAAKCVHRQWLEAHAELLGAIRLPQGSFKRHAGTDVVADILFLRKRERPQYKTNATTDWIQLGEAPMEMLQPGQENLLRRYYGGRYSDVPRTINQYFAKRPGMVLGKLKVQSGQYGAIQLLPEFKGSERQYKERLDEIVHSLPENVFTEQRQDDDVGGSVMNLNRVGATEVVKPGSFVLHDARIHISEGATWVEVDEAYAGKARERVLGMIKVRDAARRLINQQSQSRDEAEFKSRQYALNTVYDAFVTQHGDVHDKANVRLFRSDPEMPLLLSLEVFNEDDERFEKAAIFSRRTVGHREPPATAANAREAMLISLAAYGRMVLPDMAKRLGVTTRSLVESLEEEGLAYIDPEDGKWKPADEYLSGHIRNKIQAAKAAGKKYLRNQLALEAVIPADLGPADVEVRLGAPWVPLDVIATFVSELVKEQLDRLTVSYDAGTATWSVVGSSNRGQYIGDYTLNNSTWGTSDRCAVELLESALNQVPPKITRKDADGSTYVDKKATLAAREKWEAIKQEFRKWCYADEARRDRLLRIYNDEFNQVVDRRYDGSHLILPGMSGVIEPYPHQMDATWRILTGGNTMLAHAVGAGKTFTMAAACMEMRRIGKAAKPAIVVPNHLLEQIAGDVVRFYPNANVLMASKENFQGDKRREFTARVATGDWDVVVMTHSTFERLPMRPETVSRFVLDIIDQARLALATAEDASAKRTVKQIEKIMKVFDTKLELALQAGAKDDLVYFDDLGIDFLCIDEAHLFKNLLRISKMPQIAGLPTAASNRAFDLWVKTSVLMEQRGGKEEGVVLSTATPISNSVAEIHVMMKYLIPATLKRMGLFEFDAFAATFGESVTGMEVAPDGSGYRLNTRFSRYVNVPELMSVFRLCADIRTRSMVNLPAPAIKGGKPQTIMCEPSAELKEFTKTLVKRAEAIRSGTVKPDEDNMLSVTNAGRKAALDMRLIDPVFGFDENNKVAAVVKQVLRIREETHEKRGTQVAFCDLSTPSNVAFSVYNDIRHHLEAAGVPRSEIEFIHDHDSDAAKEKLFRRVRAGLVRVILGSTSKLGTGTNFQKRLKAVHQVDQPWRPSDVEQRDGRGLRPGNEWEEIELLRYVTKGSFDAYQAQTLETKAGFIEQIMSAQSGVRTMEDIGMGALTFAEIKAIASGNPLVLEKATIDADVMRLSTLESSWEDARWRLATRKGNLTSTIATIERDASTYQEDANAVAQQLQAGWRFIPGRTLAKAGEATTLAARIGLHVRATSALIERGGRGRVGEIAGFQLEVHKGLGVDLTLVSSRNGLRVEVDRSDSRLYDAEPTGNAVLDRLATLVNLPQMQAQRLKDYKSQLVEVERELAKGFEHADRLKQLVLRQREIETILDLDKDEAGTETAEESGCRKVPETEDA